MKKITKQQFLEMMSQVGRMHYHTDIEAEGAKKQLDAILTTLEAGKQTLLTDVLFRDYSRYFKTNPFESVRVDGKGVYYTLKEDESEEEKEWGIILSKDDQFYLLDNGMVAYVAQNGFVMVYSDKATAPYSLEGRQTKEFYMEKVKKLAEYNLIFLMQQIPQEFLTIDFIREAIKARPYFINDIDRSYITREIIDLHKELSEVSLSKVLNPTHFNLLTDEELVEYALGDANSPRYMDWDRLEGKGLLKEIIMKRKEAGLPPLRLHSLFGMDKALSFKKKYLSPATPLVGEVSIEEDYSSTKRDDLHEAATYRIYIELTEDGREEPLIRWLFDYMEYDLNKTASDSYLSGNSKVMLHVDSKEGHYILAFQKDYARGEVILNEIRTTFKDLPIQVSVDYFYKLKIETFSDLCMDFLKKETVDLEAFHEILIRRKELNNYGEERDVLPLIKACFDKLLKPYIGKKIEMVSEYSDSPSLIRRTEETTTLQGTLKQAEDETGYGLFPKGSRGKYYNMYRLIHSIKEIKKFD